jgi:hypothetical protein
MLAQRHNTGGLVGGAILIGLGLIFLLAQFFNFSLWPWLWPSFIIAIGGAFFVGMLVGGRPAAPLAIPGSIIGTVGLMLLYQNITNRWGSWAYAWTLILMAVGFGLWVAGHWGDNAHQRQAGGRVLQIGFVLFVIFGAFFEVVLSSFGGSALTQAFFPILLILLGLYLVVRRTGLWPSRPSNPPVEQAPTPPSEPPQA